MAENEPRRISRRLNKTKQKTARFLSAVFCPKREKMELKDKKLFLLDMDGTIYLDSELFDGTLDFLEKVKKKQGRYLFVTNNSSKSVSAYVDKLNRIGIAATADDFLTSTEATVLYLKNNYPDKRFYSIGTKSFNDELLRQGIDIVTDITDGIFGVIISNDQELTFKKLDDASKLLTNGVSAYIATNPDWVCPTAYGYVPDCGSFAEMLFRATGKRPVFIGKPEPAMLLLAMEKYGYSKDETLMVGDRVYTDIASGFNAGVDTVFVLSGEGTLADAENTTTKPTYIMQNIRELCDRI